MRTPKPPALTAAQQTARAEARFANEVAASERLGALALGPVDVEAQPGALPESVVRALAVFESNAPKDRPAQGARLAELADMEITVSEGIGAIRILIDEMRRDASYEQAKALQKRHGELSVSLFRA